MLRRKEGPRVIEVDGGAAITDLLNPETESGLKIKDSPDCGVYVDGLREETVSTGMYHTREIM